MSTVKTMTDIKIIVTIFLSICWGIMVPVIVFANEQEESTWRRCQEAGKSELYEAYLKEYPNGIHTEEATKTLADKAYQAAREKDTIEAYESFLNHYGNEAALKRLHQLRYEKAVKSGILEDWEAFYDNYKRYTGWAEFEQMRENGFKEIERLLYERIVVAPTLELCKEYLNRYSGFGLHEYLNARKYHGRQDDLNRYNFGLHKQQVMIKMEPLLFDKAKSVNAIEFLEEYLANYPDGPNIKQVQELLDPPLFKKAQDDDRCSAYEDYIKKCPDGTNVQKAKDRIAWLKENKAIVEIDYPKVIERTGDRWSWTTKFKETGGKTGYNLSGWGFIYDSAGNRWGFAPFVTRVDRKEIQVPAGGTESDEWWCDDSKHKFCNGYALFTWQGEDAGGNYIEITEKVMLKHADCTGPKD